MATRKQRRHMIGYMDYLYQYRYLFDYLERRPMRLPFISPYKLHKMLSEGKRIIADCSEAVTAVCNWVGLKDPNGLGYNGWGNSETMLAFLRNYVSPRLARRGAIVHFKDPDDVAFVYKVSPLRGDPLLWGHGRPGISILRLSVKRTFHNGPVTFLSISKL